MKLPIKWQWKASRNFQHHDITYAFSDKVFKLLTWSLLTAVTKKVAYEKGSDFFFVIFGICWLCVTSWLTQLITDFFLNRLYLANGMRKIPIVFLLLPAAFISIIFALSVQNGFSKALDNIIILQGAK